MAPKKRLSKHTVDDLLTSQRQRSLSSASDNSSEAHRHLSPRPPRPNRKQPSINLPRELLAAQADVATPPSEQTGLDSQSRRESTSTMRNSSTPFDGPLTYTPTTHRISKAKKGKRVHACEFTGCGKVFTRAEHKRRHELNHNPEATFPCNKPGCRKAFHRLDLLQRHQERHDIEGPSAESSGRRHISAVSMAQEPPSSLATPSMTSQHTPSIGQRHPAGALPIPSLMNPQDHGEHVGVFSTSDSSIDSYGSRPQGPFGDFSEGYESSHSTISDNYGRTYHRSSVSSLSSPFEGYNPTMINTSMAGGHWMLPGPPVMPSIMFEDGKSGLPPVGISANSVYNLTEGADQSHTDTAVSNGVSFSDVDAFEWTVIRRDLSSVPGLVRDGTDGTGIFDTVRWQSCLECYWQFFHPSFPIIHRPTFFTTQPQPSPLLAGAMVAIGSQYDKRADAKLYSLTLLETATNLLQRRENINSRSRLSDLQTILLLEVLSKYRSRRTESGISPRFRYLYASLDQTRYGLVPVPFALLKSRRPPQNAAEVEAAYKFWIEQETKRRILQACFILDTQQALLFEQPPALVKHAMPRLRTKDLGSVAPFPSSHDLWESSPVEKWAEQARGFDYTDVPTAAKAVTSETSQPVDHFQSRLLLAHFLSLPGGSQDMEQSLFSLSATTYGSGAFDTEISVKAAMLMKSTPIRALLTVSGESWLLGRKVNTEEEFRSARRTLRKWVVTGEDSISALWHATQLLRSLVEPEDRGTGERERALRFRDTHMLHENWVVYVASLVCWAHGHCASLSAPSTGVVSSAVSIASEPHSQTSSASTSTASTNHPTLIDPAEADAEMREYLAATDVGSRDELRDLDPRTLCRTYGLLETIRTLKIGGSFGGLMNEAERVLFRLVEGRSRLSHF